jgi:hypothetical protein
LGLSASSVIELVLRLSTPDNFTIIERHLFEVVFVKMTARRRYRNYQNANLQPPFKHLVFTVMPDTVKLHVVEFNQAPIHAIALDCVVDISEQSRDMLRLG